MQVSLKQSELTAAVRQYIAKQGINLVGKDVEVKFSATRGDAGIMATIDIEESDIPELTPNMPAQLRVINAVAQSTPALAAVSESPGTPFVAEPGIAFQAENDAGDTTQTEEPAKVKGVSLFA